MIGRCVPAGVLHREFAGEAVLDLEGGDVADDDDDDSDQDQKTLCSFTTPLQEQAARWIQPGQI